jgi:hypothetical protein
VSGTYRRMIVRPENLTSKTMRYSNLLSTLIRSDLDELKNAPEPQDDPGNSSARFSMSKYPHSMAYRNIDEAK